VQGSLTPAGGGPAPIQYTPPPVQDGQVIGAPPSTPPPVPPLEQAGQSAGAIQALLGGAVTRAQDRVTTANQTAQLGPQPNGTNGIGGALTRPGLTGGRPIDAFLESQLMLEENKYQRPTGPTPDLFQPIGRGGLLPGQRPTPRTDTVRLPVLRVPRLPMQQTPVQGHGTFSGNVVSPGDGAPEIVRQQIATNSVPCFPTDYARELARSIKKRKRCPW
jgi:hypothetical protein